MLRTTSIVILTFFAFALSALTVPARAFPNDKKTQPEAQPAAPALQTPMMTPSARHNQQMGGMDDMVNMDHMALMARVDSTMRRMNDMIVKSNTLSTYFGDLAELHHGADRAEILTMQQMSKSMGIMASEVNVVLRQYKTMVEDETSSEPGQVKGEVDGLKSVIDRMATQIESALSTLETIQGQMGQG
jgi:hypothetical protein